MEESGRAESRVGWVGAEEELMSGSGAWLPGWLVQNLCTTRVTGEEFTASRIYRLQVAGRQKCWLNACCTKLYDVPLMIGGALQLTDGTTMWCCLS